jgi:peptidoglycan hydrolase-like protein with peptidoglycan-binding domain
MQQRLYAIGMLDDSLVEYGYFCEFTHTALQEFQANRGLPQDGVCDRNAWDALIEASWLSGARLLYLTSPHLRGDDVSALQTNLAQLGFDCGRIDGILGPNTVRSLTDFQQNYGLVADGICGPETLRALSRMSSQTGTGPGIVSVRESEKLHQAAKVADSLKIVVGCFGDLQSVSRGLTRTLREQYDNVMTMLVLRRHPQSITTLCSTKLKVSSRREVAGWPRPLLHNSGSLVLGSCRSRACAFPSCEQRECQRFCAFLGRAIHPE